MKLNLAILMVMFLAFSGFTWGDDDSSSSKKSNDTYMPKKRSSSSMSSSRSNDYTSRGYATAPAATSSSGERANAVKVLTAGDPETRKARMDSLSRLAKSLAAAKQAKANQQQQATMNRDVYQY